MGDDDFALQNRIAIMTFDRLEQPWSRAAAVYVELGVTAKLEYAVERAGALSTAGLPTAAEFDAWAALRAQMAEPARGAWFTARLLLDVSGRYRFEFDWDQEPAWPVSIDVDGGLLESRPVVGPDLRDDLRRHPRSDEPTWLRERIAADVVEFEDGELDGELRGLTASKNWGLVRTVTRETIDALASGGSTEGLDEEEVASSVLSEVLGATQGLHFVRRPRACVPDVSRRLTSSLARTTHSERSVAAVPVLEKIAAFELSRSRASEAALGARSAGGDPCW